MNQKTWSLGLFIILMYVAGCKQAQAPQTTDGAPVWKATITYCIGKEGINRSLLQYGVEVEMCDIYNFKILNQTGSFRALLDTLYNDAISLKHPLYDVDVINNLNPMQMLNDSAIALATTKTDSVADSNGKVKAVKKRLPGSDVYGLFLNHEWLYNTKENKVSVKITDGGLAITSPGRNYNYIFGAFKFSPRANDTAGYNQDISAPEIAWARNINLPILYDSLQGGKLMVYNPGGSDTMHVYKIDETSSRAFLSFPQALKTMFNKNLVEWIWNAAQNGSLPAYRYKGTGQVGDKMSMKDVKNAGMRRDTVGDEKGNDTIITQTINPSNLMGLEVIEDISFNKTTYSFDSKITYAAILVQCTDHKTGLAIPYNTGALYWVKFE